MNVVYFKNKVGTTEFSQHTIILGRPEENWIIVWSSLVRCHYSALAATV